MAVQYEWFGHNLINYCARVVDFFIDNDDLSKVIAQTNNADIGPTIFDDSGHGLATALLKISYGLLNTPIFIIEAFIKKASED